MCTNLHRLSWSLENWSVELLGKWSEEELLDNWSAEELLGNWTAEELLFSGTHVEKDDCFEIAVK